MIRPTNSPGDRWQDPVRVSEGPRVLEPETLVEPAQVFAAVRELARRCSDAAASALDR